MNIVDINVLVKFDFNDWFNVPTDLHSLMLEFNVFLLYDPLYAVDLVEKAVNSVWKLSIEIGMFY